MIERSRLKNDDSMAGACILSDNALRLLKNAQKEIKKENRLLARLKRR